MAIGIESVQPGDMVICAREIYNDGSFPGSADEALLVSTGRRGVVINVGYIEAQPNRQVFLVRFEQPDSEALGPEIGCWAEDISLLPH